MAIDHRLPAIFTALFSSVGVVLAAYSGASCNFLVRITEYDEDDKTIFDKELEGISGSFGVLCEHDLFSREGDKYWELSRLFLILGLSLGSLTAALAWAVATFLTPTDTNWRGISILAALTAVLQVPIFVLFEAEPCLGDLEDIDLFADSNVTTGLGCQLGPGSYLLIASDLLFIGVTVLTQCFDRPKWGLDKDIWKVHKKGDSERKKKKKKGGPSKSRSRAARNDDYYYDDTKNYDDNIHLTSSKAQSIVSSEDDNDENVFTSHSRVLPAGEAKREKEEDQNDGTKPRGFFAKLFGFASPTDHLEVPVGETKSMDDEYDYESQLLHNLEIIRVLPQQEEQTQISTKSSPSPATVPSAEGEEVSIGAYDKLLTKTASKDSSTHHTKIRNIQSFEAVVDDGTTLIPWMPSAAVPSNLVEQHQMIDSPSASLNSSLMCADTNSMSDNHKPIISSVTDILQDLKCEEIASDPYQSKSPARATSPPVVPRKSPSPQFVAPPAPVSETAVEFNGKAPKKARASIVKASLRNMSIFQKKGGYAQMNSDQSSSGGDTETDDESKDNYFNYYNDMNKPPKGLQLLYSQDGLQAEGAVNESGFSSLNESAFTSDGIQEAEIKQIYDDLDNNNSNNNHNQHDDDNSLLQSSHEGGAFDPAAQFDAGSVGSAHSDPGPLSFSFGDTEFTSLFTSGSGELSPAASFTDLIKVQSEDEIPWENDFSAVSNLTPGTDDDYSQDVLPRGRPTERNSDIIRRPRRPVSPVGSIKSHCSLLLHIPIEEETEEDVKNELDPLPYSLKRTMSSPDLRAGSRPISSRRDKSTKELLKKLERLKRDMNVDSMNRGLPPRFPQKIGPADSPERSAHTRTDGSLEDGTSAMGSHYVDDSSAMLSELLSPDLDDAKIHRLSNEPLGSPSKEDVQSLPLDVLSKELESLTKDIEHTKEIEKHSASIPAKLETSSNESWKEVISPLKDSPSKEIRKDPVTPTRKDPVTPTKESICQENWKKYMSPSKDKDTTPSTLDISDDTSETDRTRSTITYDSDESSDEGGPGQIRSKSVGRARKLRKMRLLRASSLSPSRRRKPMEEDDDGSSSKNCLPLSARESRILRLQQNRKGYVSLSNDLYRNELRKGYMSLGNDRYRAESPEPYRRGLYDDPMEPDPELTPKRKTAAAANDRDDVQSAASSTDDLPNALFQPTLLNPEEPCPEFDNILDHLDLQLIDLNRPIGAEYGAEEGSM